MKLKRFIGDESGATAIEYALIASIISVVIASSLGLASTELKDIFERTADGFTP